MKIKQAFLFSVLFLILSCNAPSSLPIENHQFDAEINAFKQQDKAAGIPENVIVFTGSSSIRMWKTLATDMAPMAVINRGFGGATTPEVIQYYDNVIGKYAPEMVVLYVGENDIAAGESPQATFESVKILLQRIRKDFPVTHIVFLSMKPSIARWSMWSGFQKGNQLVKQWLERQSNMHYLDTSVSMLAADGQLKKDIFIEDGLHMNAKGYDGWTQMVRAKLVALQE